MLDNPKVSIVIPVYNGANFLQKSIDCALSQTYENCEVIVVNDGSTDDGATDRIARSYGDRIIYLEKENGGVSSAMNLGIQSMSGDYFSWLSHDDEYTSTKVADSIAALQKCGCADGSAIAYTGHYQINKDSEYLKTYADGFEPERFYTSDEMVRYALGHQTLNGCCMLIPAAPLKATGGFDEQLRYAQDALMWFRLFHSGVGLVFDGKVNVSYRLHASQTSRTRYDLFDRDLTYIAREFSLALFVSPEGAETMFLYAKRISRYGVRNAVNIIERTAKDTGYPFSFGKRMQLNVRLFFSRFRSVIKSIYYRLFLKAKV